MPTNVYGENDKFDKINGHVIPAIITKILLAKKRKLKVKLLGTGKPLREFIHSKDLANAIFKCLVINQKNYKNIFKKKLPILNVGTKDIISIKNLSKLIAKYANYKGKIIFDKTSPDGTFKKDLQSSKIYKLGWSPAIKFKDGLKQVIQNREKNILMDINNLFIISLIFIFIFIISKKFNLFNDDISYSNHKIIGSENRSPLVIGGVFFLIVFLYFNPYSSINFNITIVLITILGLMSDKNIFPNPSIRLVIQILILLNFVYFAELQISDVRIDFLIPFYQIYILIFFLLFFVWLYY